MERQPTVKHCRIANDWAASIVLYLFSGLSDDAYHALLLILADGEIVKHSNGKLFEKRASNARLFGALGINVKLFT
jgi:hypothetical protein